jgi:K+-sensing histidine kinase KdpD
VEVYSEIGEESVFVHVKDSGPGLEDIQPDQLFEKFGQVQSRSKGKHRGVGLGLYFCKLAVAGMSGTVMADDHPEGGAVFSVRIPKAKEK